MAKDNQETVANLTDYILYLEDKKIDLTKQVDHFKELFIQTWDELFNERIKIQTLEEQLERANRHIIKLSTDLQKAICPAHINEDGICPTCGCEWNT